MQRCMSKRCQCDVCMSSEHGRRVFKMVQIQPQTYLRHHEMTENRYFCSLKTDRETVKLNPSKQHRRTSF